MGEGAAAGRRARDEARELVKKGMHPSHARASDKAKQVGENADTVKVIADKWLAEASPNWSPYYLKQVLTGLVRRREAEAGLI